MSHGCKPVEITSAEEEEESDEDEMEVDDDARSQIDAPSLRSGAWY